MKILISIFGQTSPLFWFCRNLIKLLKQFGIQKNLFFGRVFCSYHDGQTQTGKSAEK